jgi:hypothetical protein
LWWKLEIAQCCVQLQFTDVGGALFVSFARIEATVMLVGRQKVAYTWVDPKFSALVPPSTQQLW